MIWSDDAAAWSAVLGAIALVAGALFAWAAFFRKTGRSRAVSFPIAERRRKRRRLNPTLAETGGLPPRKTEGQETVIPIP